jgi:hypothetical protein
LRLPALLERLRQERKYRGVVLVGTRRFFELTGLVHLGMFDPDC